VTKVHESLPGSRDSLFGDTLNRRMSKAPPHLLISYQLPLPEEALRPFVDAVKAPGLDVVVEPRPPSGPFAGFQ